VEDVADCLIPLPAGGSVRLGELANVYRKAQDRATIAKVDGEDCVILSVNKQSGINTVTAARSVQKALDQVAADNPSLDWSVLMDQSDFINLSVNNAMVNIFLGVVLAAAVLFLFLHDWGATLVISLSMPLCIVAVFLMMQVLHITMNIMSLGGVAMGVGMIVDNSIVVLENIFRYRADGADNYTACTQGTGEVALSIIASTLTTVAVFLPLGLTKGIVGMLFYDFCLTICALILMSLVVALTIVPLLCYGLLGRSRKSLSARAEALAAGAAAKPRTVDRLAAWYRRRLNYYITHRRRAMVLTVALVVLFGASIALAGFEMIPSVDQGTLSVTLDLPVGAETTEAELLAERVADVVLKTVPETDSVYYTTVSINLVPLKERSRSADQIGRQLRQDLSDIAGAKISVSSSGMMDMSALTGAPIDVTLSGSDYQDLESAAAGLTETLSALPDAADVASSAAEQVPEVDVTIRRDVAARYGLTAAAIGSAARSQLTGSTATTLKVNGEKIDVVIRGEGDTGKSLDNLKSMPVTTPLGSSVPLSMVADIHVVMAPQTINRMNQSRTITITGQSRSGDSAGIAKAVTQAVDGFDLPDGVSVSIGGENSEMIKSFRSLGTALVVALGLVYFVLASQFESFLMPVIVMMILPVSLIGSLSTQVFFGMKISIIAFVGVIMLSGVVVNSSIVLVDYIKTRRLRGEEKNEAILNACPRRVRPVLMTALTTILGLVPMAVGTGEGSELMRSMAVVMISGMVISTVVTLLFTPVYYSLLDGMSQNFADRRKKTRESRVQNQ
jgi:HAE1 family hydrophobic/amphiphilic exporter-1